MEIKQQNKETEKLEKLKSVAKTIFKGLGKGVSKDYAIRHTVELYAHQNMTFERAEKGIEMMISEGILWVFNDDILFLNPAAFTK